MKGRTFLQPSFALVNWALSRENWDLEVGMMGNIFRQRHHPPGTDGSVFQLFEKYLLNLYLLCNVMGLRSGKSGNYW